MTREEGLDVLRQLCAVEERLKEECRKRKRIYRGDILEELDALLRNNPEQPKGRYDR